MKLPDFEHVNPSTSRAQVQPVMRRSAPQRKALQLTPDLVDVGQEFNAEMQGINAISNAVNRAIGTFAKVQANHAEAEASTAANQYMTSMGTWMSETKRSDLFSGTDDEEAWVNADKKYIEHGSSLADQLREGLKSTQARREFDKQIGVFDRKAVPSMMDLYQDKLNDQGAAHNRVAITNATTPVAIEKLVMDGISAEYFDSGEGVRLLTENLRRVSYHDSMMAVQGLRGQMDGMTSDEFEDARAGLLDEAASNSRLLGEKWSSVINELDQLESEYDGMVGERQEQRMLQIIDMLYDPQTMGAAFRMLGDPREKDALGADHYLALKKIAVAAQQKGVTDVAVYNGMYAAIDAYRNGLDDDDPDLILADLLEYAGNNQLDGAATRALMGQLTTARREKAAGLRKRANLLFKTFFLAGQSQEVISLSNTDQSNEMLTRINRAQLRLGLWMDENPGADPTGFAVQVIGEAAKIPPESRYMPGVKDESKSVWTVDVDESLAVLEETNDTKAKELEAMGRSDGGRGMRWMLEYNKRKSQLEIIRNTQRMREDLGL